MQWLINLDNALLPLVFNQSNISCPLHNFSCPVSFFGCSARRWVRRTQKSTNIFTAPQQSISAAPEETQNLEQILRSIFNLL